jgi:hypothetical protein
MERYIDAELAKEALTGWETDPLDEEIERAIDNIPTADVAPRAEVAREVIDEIFLRIREEFIISELGKSALNQLEAEFKKKYTEEKI